MSDHYDNAVAHLTEHPEQIPGAYSGALGDDLYSLFQFVTPTGLMEWLPTGEQAGDPVTIRMAALEGDVIHGWTWELTQGMRRDKGLPDAPSKIQPCHLTTLAKWQRRIDAALGRAPLGSAPAVCGWLRGERR